MYCNLARLFIAHAVVTALTVGAVNVKDFSSLSRAIFTAPTARPTEIVLKTTITCTETLTIKRGATVTIKSTGTRYKLKGATTRILKLLSSSSLTLQNVAITGGRSLDDGGAVLNEGGKLHLVRVSFSNNLAEGRGGAIFNSASSDMPTVEDCTFEGNIAGLAGGAICSEGKTTSILKSTFRANEVRSGGGGGIAINGGLFMSIRDTTFVGNKAQGDGIKGRGGGIFISTSKAGNMGLLRDIYRCTFEDNDASFAGWDIYTYGGLLGVYSSNFGSTTARDKSSEHGIVFQSSSSDALVYDNEFRGGAYPIRVEPSNARDVYMHENTNVLLDPVGGSSSCPVGTSIDEKFLALVPEIMSLSGICIPCGPGYFSNGISSCSECPEGRYSTSAASSSTACSKCPRGSYCPSGSSSPKPCPKGYYCPAAAMQLECPAGFLCPGGTDMYANCPKGYYCPSGDAAPAKCTAGKLCLAGNPEPLMCEQGSTTSADNLRCMPCPAGNYCPFNSIRARFEIVPCPKGYACPPGTTVPKLCGKAMVPNTGKTSCEVCPPGKVVNPAKRECVACPEGSISSFSLEGCTLCAPGRYVHSSGTFCADCPLGTHGNGIYGSKDIQGCDVCPIGRYGGVPGLPALVYCPECPSGRTGIKDAGTSVADACEEDPILYALWIPIGIVSGLAVNYAMYKTLVFMGERRKTKLTEHVMEHLSFERGSRIAERHSEEESMDIISPWASAEEEELFRTFREILRDIEELLVLSSSNVDFVKTIGHGPCASVKQVKVSLLAFGQAFISDTALKVFHAAQVSTPAKLTYFVQNVATLIRVCSKPHIISFYGIVWSKRAFPGVLVEYAPGGSARDYIQSRTQTKEEKSKNQEGKVEFRGLNDMTILGIAIDAAQGLAELHACSPPIYHSNIKPENVMLFPRTTDSKQSGFTAKISSVWSSRKIKDGNNTSKRVESSQIYCAPEIFQGEDFNEVSDVFSLGVLINELDSGQVPYEHLASSSSSEESALKRSDIITDHIRPLVRSNLDPSVSKILRRCWMYDLLCTDRTKRGDPTFGRPSAEEIVDVLLDYRDNLPFSAMKRV